MKTPFLHSVVTRLLVGLIALTAMVQLTGHEQTDIQPSQNQPALAHVTQPLPKPTVACPDCIDGDLPRIWPLPRVTK